VSESLKKITVLVTRPAHQSDKLCHLIELQGGVPIRFPTLDIVAVENSRIGQQLADINKWDWLIFISTNAVNFALLANNGKIDAFKACAIAAVGKSTAERLKSVGLNVDLVPDVQFNTEGLLAKAELQQLKGKKCLIVRGVGGREALANSLRERGAMVEYMEVYARETPKLDCSDVKSMLKQQTLHAITITSGDALKNLIEMIGAELANKLTAVPVVVISNRIKKLAEQSGFKTIAVTENPSDLAIIKTVMQMGLSTQAKLI